MSKVLLKYWFIFDPSEVWPRQSAFESDMTSMFRARGLIADRVERMTNEEDEEVVLYITLDKSQPPEPPQPNKELQPELKEALEQ